MRGDSIDRAYALLGQGRVAEALAISTPLAAAAGADHDVLALHSSALNADHRPEEALVVNRKAAERFPASGTAWHNLAATLADLGRGADALDALARGFSAGLDSALSYQVKARAHVACGEPAEAEKAYAEATKRAPASAEIAVEQADLIWMARGDMAAAQAAVDRAFHAGAPPAPLLLAKAKMLASAGDAEGASALLGRAAEHLPDDPQLAIGAAQAALEAGRLEEAERLAERAGRLAAGAAAAVVQLAIVRLAIGRSELALAALRPLFERYPEDQSVLAWTATAARAAGDPLYRRLCDYETMVGIHEIEPPPGWASRDDFLGDLAAALDRHHVMKEHPAQQSLRHGTQTTYRLTGSSEPAVAAFFAALDAPVRAHLAKLGKGDDPLRRPPSPAATGSSGPGRCAFGRAASTSTICITKAGCRPPSTSRPPTAPWLGRGAKDG